MDFVEKLWAFFVHHQAELPALLTGIVSGVFLSLIGARLYVGSRRVGMRTEVTRLRERTQQQELVLDQQKGRLDHLVIDRDHWKAEAQKQAGIAGSKSEASEELSRQLEQSRDLLSAAARRLKRSARLRKSLRAQIEILSRRLDDMDKSDGKIWNRPAMGTVAAFRPLSVRRTPILSVVNLKGGVGKTSIAANLGAAIASTGKRILLIDMDHQGSLTSHFLYGTDTFRDARNSRRMVESAFRDGEAGAEGLRQSILRVPDVDDGEIFLLAADDKLGDVETRLMERWLSRSTTDDVRYRLRHLLHDPAISDRFDLILIDCPPRLTTGSINALTASDYILVPVLPEERSTEAVPRLFAWIRDLRESVCPDLSPLGVVGNKAKFYRDKLMSRHATLLNTMIDECRDAWGGPVRLFSSITSHEVHAARHAALDPKYRKAYLNLVESIIQEMPTYARLRTPGVPPLADLAVEGVGG